MLTMGEISEQSEFIRVFRYLKSRRKYNVLLAQTQDPSEQLLDAVSTVWLWSSLATGGNPIDQSRSEELSSEDTATDCTAIDQSCESLVTK